jgi:hypothetical protein
MLASDSSSPDTAAPSGDTAAPTTDGPQETRSVKLPLVEPVSVVPKQISPDALTAGEKGRLMLKNSFGVYALLNRAALAGYSQWTDHPEEWGQGWDAYGKRLANRMGRMTIRNSIRLGLDVALKTDPRYDRCECTGFARVGHAAKRVVIARSDYGGETFNTARVVSAMATPWISYQWYPDRLNTTNRKFVAGSSYLGWRVVNNIVAEFWPDIRRTIFRR